MKVMESRIEVIDKNLATIYLSRNMVNRRLNDGRVRQYIDSLQRGDWQLNGESIKFNKKGEMIDGQHRLTAIIKSGIPMTTMVVFDIDDEISIMDRGRNRSVTDSLLIEGMPKTVANNTTVAMAKLFYQMQRNTGNVSDGFVRYWLEENQEDIAEIYTIGTKFCSSGNTKSFRISTRTAPFLLAVYYAKNVEIPMTELAKFTEIIATGFYDNKSEASAIVLRNDLVSDVIELSHGYTDRIHATYKIEKALYDYHHGIERKITYKNINKPTYSNNPMFRNFTEQ